MTFALWMSVGHMLRNLRFYHRGTWLNEWHNMWCASFEHVCLCYERLLHQCRSATLCCMRMHPNTFEVFRVQSTVQCMSIENKRLCGMCCRNPIVSRWPIGLCNCMWAAERHWWALEFASKHLRNDASVCESSKFHGPILSAVCSRRSTSSL